jgi:putative resolvase
MEIISIKKAALMLGVTTTTLRNWDKSGFLPSFRTAGGHRRYKISDIKKILYGKENGS